MLSFAHEGDRGKKGDSCSPAQFAMKIRRTAMPTPALPPQQIALDLRVSNRWEALRAVADILERSRGLNAGPVARALWRREQAESTALGHGIALPHARIMRIADPVTVYARTKTPIAFSAPDRGPVSELFVVLVPDDADNAQHLELLARIAQMFSDSAFRSHLASATAVADVRSVFERWLDAQAARDAAARVTAQRGGKTRSGVRPPH
jgi:PTS system nitrogen regulatory IIA component